MESLKTKDSPFWGLEEIGYEETVSNKVMKKRGKGTNHKED